MPQEKNGSSKGSVSEPSKSGSNTVITLAFPMERHLHQEDFLQQQDKAFIQVLCLQLVLLASAPSPQGQAGPLGREGGWVTGVQLSDLPQLSCRKLYTAQGREQGQSASPPHQVPGRKTMIVFLQQTSKGFQVCLKNFWWGVCGDIITSELSVAWPARYPSPSSTVSDHQIDSGHVCSLRMTKADGPGFDPAFPSPGMHPHNASSPIKGSVG